MGVLFEGGHSQVSHHWRIYSPKSRQFVMFQKISLFQLRDLVVENGSRKGKNFPTPGPHFPRELF